MLRNLLNLKLIYSCFIAFLVVQFSFSQAKVVEPENIKTVILRSGTTNLYTPIISLNDRLILSFDDINADEHDYTYKIVHCDYDWNLSDLSDAEFVDGFAEDRIRDYENSFNTLQPYTHYSLTIPNESTSLKISGNYIIYVINDYDEVVFERKFVVFEPKVTVGVSVYKSRDISTIETNQSVEFIINYPDFRINNPKVEIMPVVLQNNNWQTTIEGLKPQFYRGTQLLYKYNKETSFKAGNEFWFFDTKSIRNTTLNIAKVELGRDLYHAYLYTNEERIDDPYTLWEDVNGNFVVRTLDGSNSNTDADYGWVHFYLSCLENLDGKDVFISGNFNNWELNDTNKLSYNLDTGLYEAKLLLKQGFYNYQYVTKNQEGVISNSDIDGSFYETENDYTVLVYYKEFGARYTRVIGVGYGNSIKLNN
tara:strand:- start:2 stop:1267 length:1266 start_codon:yes stop_codon:yes gene_type:complete